MPGAVAPSSVETKEVDGWVAIRARSPIWSFLTEAEAAEIGAELVRRYGPLAEASMSPDLSSQ